MTQSAGPRSGLPTLTYSAQVVRQIPTQVGTASAQRFRVECDAENVARQDGFPYTAVCGALSGCDQAVCVHPEGDLLVIGLLFSCHEHRDETASILPLGKSGFGEVPVRIDLGLGGTGGKSVF
ncbi:hypothetical protein ACFQ71_38655 [Streptomyces sp. NPDC056534]|uniref:hypothetical protein n=1 Tax=Streptomyces sp. NPDC056534 TaxID=3345857 RepID=UPI0036A260FE